MNDNSPYQLNRVFLFFKNKETEKAYKQYAYRYDRQTFSVMTFAAVVLNIAVLFTDVNRIGEWQGAAMTRISASIVLLLGFILTFYTSDHKPNLLQFIIFATVLLLIYSYMVSMSITTFPDYSLPNTIATCVFFSISVSGLRFRYSLIYFLLTYISYIVLFSFIKINNFWASQIVDVTVNSLIGLTAAYIIEISRRNNFVKNRLVEFQKAELESVDALKNKLFSVLSHDLRGPLRKLVAMLDMLKKHQVSREDFEEHTEKIEEEVKITYTFMENLLFWSKSLISGFESVKKEMDIKHIVLQHLAIFEEAARAKNIHVDNNIVASLMVVFNEDTLNISLRNLLSNAIKFTPTGGKVEINHRLEKEFIDILVSDTGIGIEPERLAGLFSLKTVSTPGSEGEKGTGLGLYLLREFLERNGGSISCESEAGKGSTFCIRLPRDVK